MPGCVVSHLVVSHRWDEQATPRPEGMVPQAGFAQIVPAMRIHNWRKKNSTIDASGYSPSVRHVAIHSIVHNRSAPGL